MAEAGCGDHRPLSLLCPRHWCEGICPSQGGAGPCRLTAWHVGGRLGLCEERRPVAMPDRTGQVHQPCVCVRPTWGGLDFILTP